MKEFFHQTAKWWKDYYTFECQGVRRFLLIIACRDGQDIQLGMPTTVIRLNSTRVAIIQTSLLAINYRWLSLARNLPSYLHPLAQDDRLSWIYKYDPICSTLGMLARHYHILLVHISSPLFSWWELLPSFLLLWQLYLAVLLLLVSLVSPRVLDLVPLAEGLLPRNIQKTSNSLSNGLQIALHVLLCSTRSMSLLLGLILFLLADFSKV